MLAQAEQCAAKLLSLSETGAGGLMIHFCSRPTGQNHITSGKGVKEVKLTTAWGGHSHSDCDVTDARLILNTRTEERRDGDRLSPNCLLSWLDFGLCKESSNGIVCERLKRGEWSYKKCFPVRYSKLKS